MSPSKITRKDDDCRSISGGKTAKTNPAGKQTQKFNHRNLKKHVINKLFRANFS